MLLPRRVVVTGIGVIASPGRDRAEFWESLCAGRVGIRRIGSVDTTGLRFDRGAEVVDFDPATYFESRARRQLDRFAQFALIAADEAIDDAGIGRAGALGDRAAVVTGSSLGGKATEDVGYEALYARQRPQVHPLTVPHAMANSAAGEISARYGVRGPVFTLATACSSANHALGLTYHMIRDGAIDVGIAGGSEAPFSFGCLKAWEALRVVSRDTCRPFSRDRDGMILGEGGGILVMEPLDAALDRGARIRAEVVGFGMSSDAGHMTRPDPRGGASAMRRALADAGLRAEDVDYVNAHGTGTPVNDPAEVRALREVFGEHVQRLAVSSTKSMHGHTLGAAGAIEAVATVMALEHGVLPPTANFTAPDPECDIDVVPNEARAAAASVALSNSFAFGGLNATLALRRWGG